MDADQLLSCPHCHARLNVTDEQRQKIEGALAQLEEGRRLKIACPSCRQPIYLERTRGGVDTAALSFTVPEPPAPPDLGWLEHGLSDAKAAGDDIPRLLCLALAGELRDRIVAAFEKRGFMAEFPESGEDAIARMRFVNYPAVVLVEGFDAAAGATGDFRAFMSAMDMKRRRQIFYMIAGSGCHSLYDLQALAMSANLVFNPADLARIDIILQKAMADRDALFGPFLAMRHELGKG